MWLVFVSFTHYLSKRVPPQQQVRLECFLEHEARRLGVRFIMQQPIEVVICGFLFVATILVTVYVQGETSYCFSQDSCAAIDSSHLHRATFCYRTATAR